MVIKLSCGICNLFHTFRAYKKACESDSIVVLIQTNYFGHLVNRLDFYQRTFQCKKFFYIFSALEVDESVIDYFSSDNSQIQIVQGLFSGRFRSKALYISYQIFRLYGILKNYRSIVFNTDLVLRVCLELIPQIKIYSPEKPHQLINYNIPSYQRTMLDNFDNSELGLSAPLLSKANQILHEAFGSEIFVKKIVGIKLRKINYESNYYHDTGRNAYDISSYIPLIRVLQKNQFLILIDSPDLFNISNSADDVLELSKMPNDDAQLLRTYLLTHSYLVFQQHSGPVHLSNIASVDNIIIDGFPLWQGSWRRQDFFVPQEVFLKKTNKKLGLVNILKYHKELFMGKYDQNLYEFRPSRLDYIESCLWERDNLIPQFYRTNLELKNARAALKELIPKSALNRYSFSKFPEKLIFEEIGNL